MRFAQILPRKYFILCVRSAIIFSQPAGRQRAACYAYETEHFPGRNDAPNFRKLDSARPLAPAFIFPDAPPRCAVLELYISFPSGSFVHRKWIHVRGLRKLVNYFLAAVLAEELSPGIVVNSAKYLPKPSSPLSRFLSILPRVLI